MQSRANHDSMRRPIRPPRQERGAVAVIIALSLVGLIGFMGLALDLGKLFVAKSELQNSADACALAAARELTGANEKQLELAKAAGIATGRLHDVLFQGEAITEDFHDLKVGFSKDLYDAPYDGEDEPLAMRFAHCEVKRPEIANWFIQVLNLLPGVEIGEQTVGASAVATLVPGQTTCAIPVAICEAGLEDKSKGDWLFTLLEPGDGLDGNFLWASVNSSNKEIKDILTGSSCDIPASNTPIGSPGVKGGAYNAWNTRFGLYQGSNSPTNAVPDFTGFTYTAKSWSQCKNAFDDFAGKRANYAPYQDAKNKSDHTGLKFPVDPSSVLTHREGGDRRLVTVPVVDCSVLNGPTKQTNAKSWACVLMLHPLDNNPENAAFCPGQQNRAALEYLGPADDPKSPCASEGVPGGQNSVGPLVPALVR